MEKNNQPQLYIQEENIDFKKYLYLFLANWYWFFLTIIIALSIAFFKNKYATTYYQASTTLIIDDIESQDDALSFLPSMKYLKKQVDLQNERAKLKSYKLARRTIDKLNFDVACTGYGRIKEKKLYKNSGLVFLFDTSHIQLYGKPIEISGMDSSKYHLIINDGYNVDTIINYGQYYEDNNFKFCIIKTSKNLSYQKYIFTIQPRNLIANNYKNKLVVEANSKETGTVITLILKGEIAEQEIDYLNKLCEEYISFDLEQRNKIAENTLKFIDDQITTISDSLKLTEKDILNYRLNNQVYDLSQQGKLSFERLKELQTKKMDLVFKDKYIAYLKEYLNKNKNPKDIILPSMVNINEPLLFGRIEELLKVSAELDEINYTAKSDNPQIDMVNKKAQKLYDQIIEITRNINQNNQSSINQLENEITKVNGDIKKLPINERELINIERKFDINNKFYTFLLERRAEAGIKKASNISNKRIIDEAMIENITVIANKKSIILLIALLLGFLLPGFIIIILDLLNPTISSREDIEKHTKVPIIGTLGHDNSKSEIPVYENPQSPFTESFRKIRTNIQYILRDKEKKVIMITSTISGEGKTFVTVNLASIIAMSGKKVLLIGLDLRRPKLHKIFNCENKIGLSTFLISKSSFEDIIIKTNIKNLDIAPAGQIPPNPAELIETERMKEFFDKARLDYDYVIMDTPPIALVTDSLLLSEFADASIFILRQKYTHKDVLILLNELYVKNKFQNLSILVNDISVNQALGYKYYYGYGYGYHYGYGYGYGNEYAYLADNEIKDKKFTLGNFRKWLKS